MDLVYFPAAGWPWPVCSRSCLCLHDLAEASAYLCDPLLRARYQEIASTVSDQLSRGRPLEELMGSTIDALKFVSSVTLFRAAAKRLAEEEATFEPLAQRCDLILQQTATQGYAPCAYTLAGVAG